MEWRAIPGHPGYEITRDGRVRSIGRVVIDSLGRTRNLKGKELTLIQRPDGYMVVHVQGRAQKVHRLVMLTFVGAPGVRHVRHLNGNPGDNRLENLAYDDDGTQNARDTVEHGRNVNKNKTHCPAKHPLAGPNLYTTPQGYRVCRTCRAKAAREHRARRKARTLSGA